MGEYSDRWEDIVKLTSEGVRRMRVPGGWIYESYDTAGSNAVALCFVPDVSRKKGWSEGYEAGFQHGKSGAESRLLGGHVPPDDHGGAS